MSRDFERFESLCEEDRNDDRERSSRRRSRRCGNVEIKAETVNVFVCEQKHHRDNERC
ncbi:hypothetical protein ACOAKC_04195 [Hathewaya histolytica]|uniref:hypothetical protein n=1 Tax=Hathewaya histolytica TaxID=1498 RepID=UPI003B66EAB7